MARLSKIYTRTGDKGTTGLADGSRVEKDHQRMETIGEVDELNSFVGVLLARDIPDKVRGTLTGVQHALFDLGGELAIPGSTVIAPEYVTTLEQALDELNQELPPLEEFILPSGGPAAAACHVARSVCRRTERRLVTLAREVAVNQESRHYVNRLSDLLFVLARVLARREGGEVYWQRGVSSAVK
uniref:Corrinoid adenosyltransferase n=1 Tax=Candidatus Kentrum eta TaxID=2126337 RepID=A0A450UPM9_9GAMM|nr:MAG: ATP:cob(I)alamin adenosyltransferase [Candidatus Kentron sp. H]VFJ94486.1 MAG: ATP:cob(I)alamin adenosyltransferase [Candidatus Kentron sp. H]VFK00984.1 MAG: ATP:cob(I)alamin adenosyltransferase [Candidatus Kentron sp. H]